MVAKLLCSFLLDRYHKKPLNGISLIKGSRVKAAHKGPLLLYLYGDRFVFNMALNVIFFAKCHHSLSTGIVKRLAFFVRTYSFTIIRSAKNNLVSKLDRFQNIIEILLNNIWCRIRLDTDPRFAT